MKIVRKRYSVCALLTQICRQNNEWSGPAIEAYAFQNLVFRGNRIVNKEKAPTIEKMRGAIKVEHGSGVWIYDNDWITGKGIDAPGLFVDPGTVQRLSSGGNRVQ